MQPCAPLPHRAPRRPAQLFSPRGPPWGASRSEKGDCPSAPLPHMSRTAQVAMGVRCQVLSTAVRRLLRWRCFCLPCLTPVFIYEMRNASDQLDIQCDRGPENFETGQFFSASFAISTNLVSSRFGLWVATALASKEENAVPCSACRRP